MGSADAYQGLSFFRLFGGTVAVDMAFKYYLKADEHGPAGVRPHPTYPNCVDFKIQYTSTSHSSALVTAIRCAATDA